MTRPLTSEEAMERARELGRRVEPQARVAGKE